MLMDKGQQRCCFLQRTGSLQGSILTKILSHGSPEPVWESEDLRQMVGVYHRQELIVAREDVHQFQLRQAKSSCRNVPLSNQKVRGRTITEMSRMCR